MGDGKTKRTNVERSAMNAKTYIVEESRNTLAEMFGDESDSEEESFNRTSYQLVTMRRRQYHDPMTS